MSTRHCSHQLHSQSEHLHDHQIRITSTPLDSLAACWNYRTWIVREMRNLDPRSVIYYAMKTPYRLSLVMQIRVATGIYKCPGSDLLSKSALHFHPPLSSLPSSLSTFFSSPLPSFLTLILPFSLPYSFPPRPCLPVSGSESSTEEWAAGQKRIPNWLRLYESLQVLFTQHQLQLIILLRHYIFLTCILIPEKQLCTFETRNLYSVRLINYLMLLLSWVTLTCTTCSCPQPLTYLYLLFKSIHLSSLDLLP